MLSWLHRKLLPSFVLGILVAAAIHAPHGNADVLCVGADGHVEIEPALGMACTTEGASTATVPGRLEQSAVPTWSSAGTDHCGECTDTPYLTHDDLDTFDSRVQSVYVVAPVLQQWQFEALTLAIASHSRVYDSPVRFTSSSHALKRSVSLQL